MEGQPFAVVTHAERPELLDSLSDFDGLWPDFIFHDEVAAQLYEHTRSTFADTNLYLLDTSGAVVACGVAVPVAWPGTSESLPEGWDAALVQAVADRERGSSATALCALGAMVAKRAQRRGYSACVIRAMKAVAVARGLWKLIAPVRPTWKSRYPTTPMERYVRWRRSDGAPFDPWLRVHWREGGVIGRMAPRSMLIRGTVAQWQAWTGLEFPESGTYVVPGALQPVAVDLDLGQGIYEEPNVWVEHRTE